MKIYIINLKRSTQRYQDMRQRVAELLDSYPHLQNLIEFEFFSAIDGAKDEHKAFSTHYSARLCILVRGKELSGGELACFASHYVLWQRCARDNLPCVIIEDDICFTPHFAQGIIDIMQSQYEYVRLMQTRTLKKYKPTSVSNIVFTSQICNGTQGYYLTPSAAQKFLSKAGKWVFPVDDYMDMFYIHKVWILVSLPYLLISQDNGISSILDRKVIKLSRFNKITREIFRLCLQIYKKLFCLTHRPRF